MNPTSGEDDTTTNNPITEAHADPFIVMPQLDAWNYTLDYSNTTTTDTTKAADTTALIFKSCVVDLTLNYCTRLSTRLTNDYFNILDTQSNTKNADGTTSPVSYPTLASRNGVGNGSDYRSGRTIFRLGADGGGGGGVTGVDNKCRPIDCLSWECRCVSVWWHRVWWRRLRQSIWW